MNESFTSSEEAQRDKELRAQKIDDKKRIIRTNPTREAMLDAEAEEEADLQADLDGTKNTTFEEVQGAIYPLSLINSEASNMDERARLSKVVQKAYTAMGIKNPTQEQIDELTRRAEETMSKYDEAIRVKSLKQLSIELMQGAPDSIKDKIKTPENFLESLSVDLNVYARVAADELIPEPQFTEEEAAKIEQGLSQLKHLRAFDMTNFRRLEAAMNNVVESEVLGDLIELDDLHESIKIVNEYLPFLGLTEEAAIYDMYNILDKIKNDFLKWAYEKGEDLRHMDKY